MTDLDRMRAGLNVSRVKGGASTWVYYRISLGEASNAASFDVEYQKMLNIFRKIFKRKAIKFNPNKLDVRISGDSGLEFYLCIDYLACSSLCEFLDSEGIPYTDCSDISN